MVAPAKKLFDEKYEIVSVIGRGSTSVVYKALDVTNGHKEVALKVLKNKKSHRLTAKKLQTEAIALASAKDTHIIQIFDFCSVDDLSYLVLEYSPLSDLRSYLETKNRLLSYREGILFLKQVAHSLLSVHKAGFVHGDVTPDNILVMSKHTVKLSDFGEATYIERASESGDLRGFSDKKYQAPEHLINARYDQRSDIYSLGLSFYELLSGALPFQSHSQQAEPNPEPQMNVMPDIRLILPDIPEDLAKVVMRSARYLPKNRFQSASELCEAVKDLKVAKQPLNGIHKSFTKKKHESLTSQTIESSHYRTAKEKIFSLLDALDERVSEFGGGKKQLAKVLHRSAVIVVTLFLDYGCLFELERNYRGRMQQKTVRAISGSLPVEEASLSSGSDVQDGTTMIP